MATILQFLSHWLMIIIPQPCFDEYFVKFNFLDVVCLKIVVSKALGYGIILGSVMVKIPQILKIVRAGNARGINIFGVSLELAAASFSLSYGYANGYPFSAYGEACFLVVQTLIIAFLVCQYTFGPSIAIFYSVVYSACLAYLLSPLASKSLLWFLQASIVPNIVLGRMIQAFTNYKNGSTGQLSAITFFLLFAGSVARVFTSLQETGDNIIVLTFLTSSLCNGLIVTQILYYWNSDKQKTA